MLPLKQFHVGLIDDGPLSSSLGQSCLSRLVTPVCTNHTCLGQSHLSAPVTSPYPRFRQPKFIFG